MDYTMMPRNIMDSLYTWHCRKAVKEEWCSGFWPGVLWYDYEYTGDKKIREEAEKFTASLKFLSETPAFDHDLGFLVFCSYGNGYRLTHNPEYKRVILAAADTLATLYRPQVGTILSWPRNVEMFGGEPLLYFREELYPLLAQIKQDAEERQRKASFFFVTNAVCITPDTLPLFDRLNASFQISIDGYKDRHDRVKFIPGTREGTYDRMIETVYSLTRNLKNTYINLRLNYDDETLPHMADLIQDLIDVDRHKVGIHLERVWQTGHSAKHDNQALKAAIDLWMLNGFKVSYMNLGRRSFSCKASAVNQAIFSYDGTAYKCSGRDFTPQHCEGTLTADGFLHWDAGKLERRMNIVTYDNDLCRSCKLMPLCWGPCCQKQLESPSDLERFCQKRHMELSMPDYICYRFNEACIEADLRTPS